ncbi:MAG TPA: ABC transporter substrate-binding protein [Beijerinckiaceae bacterium]|nr:ABC transporter substrate-binding protein [Beijerinckiaceae bacterium]
MSIRKILLAAAAATLLAAPASAATFRYAFQGDLNALDPYTLNETFTLGALGNVMEGLTKRDKDLKIIPGLAERWETSDDGRRWRFYLRRNVKYHDGSPFTADDVIFSAERAQAEGSQVKSRLPDKFKIEKVDDHTVDFVMPEPNPILHYEWDTWYIFSKPWADKVGATKPQSATATSLNAWALTANGTGPFKLESHQPGVKTVFKPNPDWWGKPEHNLTEVIFTTIKSDATRVAALLSGEIDMMDPVPVQDIERIKSSPNVTVMTGPELRTIFLNMDSFRDELLYSNVKGKNPFKDARVRKAFYQAIDIEAIKSRVMRGNSAPSSILISPLLFSRAAEIKRHPYDVEASKKLLAEAGYPNGFEVTMDCPNDRYVNDEAICQAVAAMLARANVKVQLNAQPKAKYFEKAGPTAKYDSSFNLLGWTPGSFDSWNVLGNITHCRDASGKGGQFNYGGYCNPKVDALADKILVESDTAKRDAMILEAFKIVHEEAGIIPLHQQTLAWGVSKKTKIVQRADNQILLYWVNKE